MCVNKCSGADTHHEFVFFWSFGTRHRARYNEDMYRWYLKYHLSILLIDLLATVYRCALSWMLGLYRTLCQVTDCARLKIGCFSSWSIFLDIAFSAAGPRVWDYLPTDLRQQDLSFNHFRQSLKAFYFFSVRSQWHSVSSPTTAFQKSNYLLFLCTGVVFRDSRAPLGNKLSWLVLETSSAQRVCVCVACFNFRKLSHRWIAKLC